MASASHLFLAWGSSLEVLTWEPAPVALAETSSSALVVILKMLFGVLDQGYAPSYNCIVMVM